MKNFIQFMFGFLYTRDWNTGRMELSRQRTTIFCAGLGMVLLALSLISFLQAPIEVDNIAGVVDSAND